MSKSINKDIVSNQLKSMISYLRIIKMDETVDFDQVANICQAYNSILKEYIKAGFESKTRIYLTGTTSILSFAISRAMQENQYELYARVQGAISNLVRYLKEQESTEPDLKESVIQ